MDLRLAGKVALITGSSRGIGWTTAKAFAAEGCRVMLSGRTTGQLHEAETALRATGAEGCGSRRRCCPSGSRQPADRGYRHGLWWYRQQLLQG
jgi:NAD(P)-dependent dehydrogenase (short-subunit alcohol dehydrogenase family)